MRFIKKLPEPAEVIATYALTADQKKARERFVGGIRAILNGSSEKKLLCVGPCSADREDAVVEYMTRLAGLQEKVRERFLIVPRVYTGKPRTNGLGYKGLIHRPDPAEGHDDIFDGILAMRRMHLHVIQQTGMYGVDEMLYTDALDYILDLLAYVAIGARSVENQEHRLLASGLDIPVGMKNPTGGDISVLLNALTCSQCPQSLLHSGWAVETPGNPYAHAILRGYCDRSGRLHPNFHYEDLCELYDAYLKCNLRNMSVLIDCNHANSGKHYEAQGRIAKEVFQTCANDKILDRFVKGVMLESYLEDGSQMIGGGCFGKSITDGCLGWEKTERLVMELAEM